MLAGFAHAPCLPTESLLCAPAPVVFLTALQKVYTAGNPQYGQLGHNDDHMYNAKDCECAFWGVLWVVYVWGGVCGGGEEGT